MHTGDDRERRREPSWSRRAWLAAAVASAGAAWSRADEPSGTSGKTGDGPATKARDKTRDDKGKARDDKEPLDPDEQKEIDDITAKAKEAGLGPLQINRSTHYLAVGDASEAFRAKALKICERLATEFQAHFQFKGFKLTALPHSLTVVALGDEQSFQKFSGLEASPGVGGYYDRETNRLVILDNRSDNQANLTQAQQANLVSLVHEATHQLTYNTGLLSREADVPVSLSEGFATYGEIWSPTRLSHVGGDNVGRRQGLALAVRARLPWIPVTRLLTDDSLFEGGDGNDAALQLAYAESWLLVHQLMSKPSRVAPFRAYLRAIQDRRDKKSRLADARAHLQDLEELDKDLRIAGRFPLGKSRTG